MNEETSFRKISGVKSLKEVFVNLFPIFYRSKKSINIFSLCFYRLKKDDSKKVYDKYVDLNGDSFNTKFLFKKGIGIKFKSYVYYFNIYKASISLDKIKTYKVQNLFMMKFINGDTSIYMPTVYNLIHLTKQKGYHSRLWELEDGRVCYFRQAKLNSLAITIRNKNVTDSLFKRIKIALAYYLSKITFKKDIILLYEKENNKYEESASMVYERLLDLGYKNAYYIINKNSNHNSFIKDKYKSNIIYSHSFKHYYYFFKCNKFIGTESVAHSFELRTVSKYVVNKLNSKKFKYVFLQHGVMYMVALDSNTRGSFRKNGNELPNDAKIVVSSKLEAQHFIDLGNFEENDLYVTGLPFYDRTIKFDDADKIVVMLTWRPWELNEIKLDYNKSKYYQLCKKIIDNIPSKYRDKLWLLPHPLIINEFKNTPLSELIPEIASYDKILEQTDLLITDYSSIAYSAFYRGSNVIFCWDELDLCMNEYQSHLMLNEDNVFGDITYDCSNIGDLIDNNYLKGQSDKYKDRYSKIVEFHDNNNTDRLIEYLKNDKII